MPTPRRLDEIVGELLAPLLAAKPRPGGWRLASWDVEQGVCVTLARGDEWVLVELEDRDDAVPCYGRTERFNVLARQQFRPELGLSDGARRAVDQLVALVRSREGALPGAEPPPAERNAEVREIQVDRVLMLQNPGHYYLNAYAGCMIGCEFCYVRDRAALSRRLEGLAALPWGRYVDVKVNAPEVLQRELAENEPGFVRMSPILTDPYQPLEKRYRITRRCLEAMVGTGFTPVILTRASRIVEDVELLARLPNATVGLSIPTDDDDVRRAFEPGGDPIEDRLAALEACHRKGLVTVAVVQPMLPMNPERLADLLATRARVVRVDRMYGVPRVRHLYQAAKREDAMTDAFFERTERELTTALRARGVRVDPLDDLDGLFA